MEVCVARQPIFDAAAKYSDMSCCSEAASRTRSHPGPRPRVVVVRLDAEAITGGKRGFVRFTGDLIERGVPATAGEFLGIQYQAALGPLKS